MLSMGAADPVDREHDLRSRVIEIGDRLLDDGAHDPLLQSSVRSGRGPDGMQVFCEGVEGHWRDRGARRGGGVMLGGMAGSGLTALIVKSVGTNTLLLISAIALLASMVTVFLVVRREQQAAAAVGAGGARVGGRGGAATPSRGARRVCGRR